MSCIFCEIIARNIPAVFIHEDDTTISFLDIRHTNEGHCLVVSKAHYPMIDDLPLDIAGSLFAHAAVVARALRESVRPDGIQIWQSNGRAAGQEVDHVHIHVFPRYHGDGHFQIYPVAPRVYSPEELETMAKPIRARIDSVLASARRESNARPD
jgi:histidine triad (HIT) family protein